MATVTEIYAVSQAVDTTEWSMTTDTAGPDADTTNGVFQVFLDVNDMILTDVLQIKVYEKINSGATQRCIYETILRDVQSCPIWASPALALMHGWDVTCKAIAGTITVVGSIRRIGP